MRLVKKRAETLSQKKTSELMDEVQASEKTDQPFFEQGKEQRNKLKGLHFTEGEDDTTGTGLEHRIVVNLVHSHIRSLLPTVFFREPTVNARPLNPLQTGKDETWELVLNATLLRNGYKKETKAFTMDALTYHEGWKKITQVTGESGDQDDEAGDKGSSESGQTPRGPMPWGSKQIPVSIRVSPLSVIVDYLAPGRDPDHARFVAIKYKRPMSEMRADPRYKIPADFDMKSLEKSTAGSVMRRMDETEGIGTTVSSTFGDNAGVDMLTFYEVYVHQDVDRNLYRQVVWLAVGAKKPIREETWEDLFGIKFPGWPIHRLVFNPVPDDYPMSEVEVWQQLQEAVNWVSSKLVSFVSQQNQRWVMDTAAFVNADTARQQILSGRSVEIMEVKPGSTAGEALNSVQGQPVGADTYRLLEILMEFIERVSQVSQNQQQQGGVFRTATEASFVNRAAAIRGNERIDVMADFLKEDVRKIAALIRHTATRGMVRLLAGDTGRVSWENWTLQDIQWEPDIEIKVDSFRELDDQTELAKWLQIFSVAIQIFPIMGPVVRLDVIFKKLLKAARVDNPEEIVGNLVGAREFQMVEIMEMILGFPVPVNMADPHGEHMAALELFFNSPTWEKMPPEIQQTITQHYQEHIQMLEQGKAQGQTNGQPETLGQNPVDVLGGGQFGPGNVARGQSATVREATRGGGPQTEII